MAGFWKNLFQKEDNPGWGKALLGGALQGLASGQGMLQGLAGGAANKISGNRIQHAQQNQDINSHMAMANEPMNMGMIQSPQMPNLIDDEQMMRRKRSPYLNY